jgi:hypothetical protein
MKNTVCPVCMNDVSIPAEWEQGALIQCPCCYVEFDPGKG